MNHAIMLRGIAFAIGITVTVQVIAGDDDEQLKRMADPDQWPAPGRDFQLQGKSSSPTILNPLGLPSPDYQAFQRPEYGPLNPQPATTASLRIPQGQVGFYNSSSTPRVFALSVDGQQRNVRLGPEEILTVVCGRCDAESWAAIATEGEAELHKISFVSLSLLLIPRDSGQWKFVASPPVSISLPEQASRSPSWTGAVYTSR
jgi:hypothetical protein